MKNSIPAKRSSIGTTCGNASAGSWHTTQRIVWLWPMFVMCSLTTIAHAEGGDRQGQQQEAAQSDIVQQQCPVMTDKKIDQDIYADYQGKRVYFCCTFCRRTFLPDPKKYLETLPQFADKHHVEQSRENEHSLQKSTTNYEKDDRGTGHDHAGHRGVVLSGSDRTIQFLGKFHPVVVHFPIGLVIAAALAEFLFLITNRSSLANAALYCLSFGAAGAITATVLGWAAVSGGVHYSGCLALAFDLHQWLGMGTTILVVTSLILAALSQRNRQFRWGYRITLFVSALLLGATGYYGGMLVYGLGHYVW